jgi:hypothetical protein
MKYYVVKVQILEFNNCGKFITKFTAVAARTPKTFKLSLVLQPKQVYNDLH